MRLFYVHPQTREIAEMENFTFTTTKLIFFGMLLPVIDLGTDLLSIYQSWTSSQSQWILRYLAVGLCSSIVIHNVASAIYGLWIFSKLDKSDIPFMRSLGWKVIVFLSFCMGLGNVLLTFEIMADIFQRQKNDHR